MWKQLKDVRKRRIYDSYLGKGHMTLCQVITISNCSETFSLLILEPIGIVK